jgi:prepilin-type N-terminal cleavage/methylation domain-containing protein
MKSSARQKGLTLIELIVVITIISILSVIAYTTFYKTNVTARDTKRKQDIQALAKSSELFYNKNSRYPLGNYTGGSPNGSVQFSQSTDSQNPWISELTPFLIPFPLDPINNGVNNNGTYSGYAYYYLPGGDDCNKPSAFAVIAFLEIPFNNPPVINFKSCTGTTLNLTGLYVRLNQQ